MISDKYKFICFRMGKTASTSIRALLKPYSNREIHIRMTVKKVMANMEKRGLNQYKWDNYFKFAFVRNPYERLVSRYIQGCDRIDRDYYEYDGDKTPEDFFKFVINFNDYFRTTILQYDRLCDKNGKIPLNFIGKVENIDKDMKKVFKIVGLPELKVPRKNIAKRDYYKNYYTQDSYEYVTNKWKKDIEYFNYSF